MNKKEFQGRFGEDREKYLKAKLVEKTFKSYLSKYGYKLVFYVVNRILTTEKKRINLEKEIQNAEAALLELKHSRR